MPSRFESEAADQRGVEQINGIPKETEVDCEKSRKCTILEKVVVETVEAQIAGCVVFGQP